MTETRFKFKGIVRYFSKVHRVVHWDRWHRAQYFYRAPPK